MSDLHTRPLELVSRVISPAIAELAQLDQWVAWKYLTRRGKVDKPPVNPHTGKIGNGNDPSIWGSYAQACTCHRSCAGVGFVFHASDPYSGVDLDGCRDTATGQIAAWAQRWIDALGSYTEISPSGTGVKIFVRGTLPAALTHSMGQHTGIEVYSEKRYFTVTGEHLHGTPTAICDAQYALDLLWAEYHQEPTPAPARPACKVSPGEAAAGRLSARETIDRANGNHDLGQLLEAHGAQLVRTAGEKRYYSGLTGDQHTHTITYVVSPARDSNGQIGFCYSSGGALSNGDYPRGFRWFDAYLALEQNNDRVAALKAISSVRRTRPTSALHMPDYLTLAAAAKRQADRERARTNRQTRSVAGMRQIAALAEQFAESKACAYDRILWAYHQHRWQERNAPEHVDSNERIARAVVGLDRPPTASELRRLQLAHKRLISRGYLVRTIRYKPGEQNTNCWQPGDGYMVIIAPDETITMMDHESNSDSNSGACERGAESSAADAELLVYVHTLACTVDVPLDYTAWSAAALEAEALRLAAIVDQAAANSQIENLDAGIEMTGPGGGVAIVGGAAYVPPGAEGWYKALQIPINFGICDQVEPAELLDQAPEPEPMVRSAPVEPKASAEYWALKHKKPITPKQRRWVARRLAELEIWLPVSQALALEPRLVATKSIRPVRPSVKFPLIHERQRRATVSPGAEPVQLQLALELGPSRVAPFASAAAHGAPALTRSRRSRRHAPI